MTVVEALIELQEVDGRIREMEAELKDLPMRKAHESARRSGVSADLQAARANLEYAERRVSGYEEEAKELREKIQQLKQTQMGLKTNKEYQDFSIRIDLVSHDLETAENSAIAAMDDERPDLVILDVLLAGPTGFAVVHEMRSYPELENVPIIVVSSVKIGEIDEKYGISKTFDKAEMMPRDLLNSVANALEVA